VVIHKENLNKALNALHQSFFLSDTKTLNVFMIGIGLIGSTLLKQIEKQAAHLRKSRSIEINLVAVSNSKKMFFDANGISTRNFKDALEKSGEKMGVPAFIKKMTQLNLPQSIFVDCTSSEDVVKHYETILDHSISIATPNKIANSGKYKEYEKLRDSSKKRNVRFLYETNVGAGLPVISTLKDLLTSGDTILRIEAVLSGTLSFIFNNFKTGTKFSDIVHEAHKRGYTEPDPRVDLSGMDVARKLLILSRETGLNIEMNDIVIEQILPVNCRKAKSVNEFFSELEKSNDFFDEIRKKADGKKKALRFIAQLENSRATISLQEVDSNHPFYNLSGSDNIISYTTERYHERPLVVKGPGAGAEVTAAGVFAEIISIGNYFE
jgi:aspartokinase/homoserine dehydrogenase 1